jgi:predicted nucleic acid-binding protein
MNGRLRSTLSSSARSNSASFSCRTGNAARLERWFEDGVERIHCLAWEAATGLRWARLLAELRTSGQSMPIKDSLIAATALVHGLPVVSRNRRDFEKAGVEIIDPFA